MNPTSKRRFKVGEWIGVVTLLSLVAWFLIWPAFQNVRDSFSVHTWPTTQATVISSNKTTSTNGGGRTTVSHRFRYEYRVDDKAFTGWRYSLSTPSGSQSMGVQTHRAGATIDVHYHPEHPARSVIVIDASTWWNYVVLIGILFIGTAATVTSLR